MLERKPGRKETIRMASEFQIDNIKEELQERIGQDLVQTHVPMAKHTSFRAGGEADVFVLPADEQQLQAVILFLEEEKVPHLILGNGTNILVRDGGYHGVIVKMDDGFNAIRQEGNTLICGSGALLSMAARTAAHAGLTGLEFASGIPGSIGGAVFMNAGAYGGEMKDVLKEARLMKRDGTAFASVSARELEMGYRHSRLHETGEIVLEARIELTPGDEDEIWKTMGELTARRNGKQPVNYPSAGSFFKRPEGYFAGKLIQDAGLKGLSVGGAQVSQLHSGFIINRGGATATDILQLMQIVQGRVLEEFGVRLEPEVRIIGE